MMAVPQDNIDKLGVAWARLQALFSDRIPDLVRRLVAVRQRTGGGGGGSTAS